MTVGTISIMVGITLLILLKLFFRDDAGTGKDDSYGGDQEGLTTIDPSDDPGLAHLPGNSYHQSWSANHTDID